MVLCFVLHVAALALGQYSIEDGVIYASYTSSCYSIFASYSVLQQERYWDILRQTRSLVGVLQQASREVDKELDQSHRGAARIGVGQAFAATAVFVGLAIDAAVHDRYFTPLWPLIPLAGDWGRYAAAASSNFTLVIGAIAFSAVVNAVLTVSGVLAGMHRVLAARLEALAHPDEVAEVVRLHRDVRRLTLELSDFFAGNLVHVMCCTFIASVIATLQVLANDVSGTTFGMMLSVAITFAPLAYASQEVSDASLELSTAAYHAATSGLVTLGEARALLMLMRVADSTPALRCRGVGRLSLPGAGHTVSQYYSVIQTLRNKV
ncbi:Putative odorant receptor 71a [Frankliniella fusca]|uniref:Odorant receptor 71a n=1 Tax=Frankliniella fusca TaxID=407009 RepID=A0AAE1HPK6_9NEOP|nr:Putative odorant receptor 71a [Frankliniella fusca]